ncbi:MAG: sirohydrochlorin cobaltochelatase [Lachnospiraceae bacterium]
MNRKKAILLVSFGTSYLESKEKTIDLIYQDIQTAFPDFLLYHAWTCNFIINLLKERNQLHIPTIAQAMAQMKIDGIDTLIVQPTHFINGIEHTRMKDLVFEHSWNPLQISFGTPLLTTSKDQAQVLDAVMHEFSTIPPEDALVFMGHGTTHHANCVYAVLNDALKNMGYANAFMGTVEAYPNLHTLIEQVSLTHPQKVHLTPFMLVAGDHANNDMASPQQGSWKSSFEAAGFETICYIKGLGEYRGIRQIYLEHLFDAINGNIFSAF